MYPFAVRWRAGCNAVLRPASSGAKASLLATCVSLSALALASCGGGDGRAHRLPPDTFIEDKPAAITNQTHAKIVFHAAGDADGFTCLLDAAAPVPCSSPF